VLKEFDSEGFIKAVSGRGPGEFSLHKSGFIYGWRGNVRLAASWEGSPDQKRHILAHLVKEMELSIEAKGGQVLNATDEKTGKGSGKEAPPPLGEGTRRHTIYELQRDYCVSKPGYYRSGQICAWCVVNGDAKEYSLILTLEEPPR
jgi:hypothetical protein